jgi:hypothetical protein
VGIVAFYDPSLPPVSGRTSLKVYQLGAVFVIDTPEAGAIEARFIKAVAKSPKSTASNNCFTYLARLVPDSTRTTP